MTEINLKQQCHASRHILMTKQSNLGEICSSTTETWCMLRNI